MPHQCTDCGRQFDDGSKEMLSGCPSCGGTKFQFLPDRGADTDPGPEAPAPAEDSTSSVARTVGSAATAVRDLVGGGRDDHPQTPAAAGEKSDAPSKAASTTEPADHDSGVSPDADGEPAARSATAQRPGSEPTAVATPDSENEAQASARSEVVSPDELPPAPEQSGWEQTTPTPRTDPDSGESTQTDRPDLSDLRAELNQQFESIKVLEPGQYELNLMELFDREEYIIALQEDGKYTVQVPEHWQE